MQWMMVCTQVDGSVWVTLLALIWLYGCKIDESWIGSQKGEISIPDHIDSVSVHQETFELIFQFFDTHTDDLSVCVSVGDLSQCVCVCVCVFQWEICGECPARMSGDQRDSGNLKMSVFLHPDPSEDKELLMFHYPFLSGFH